MRSIMLAVTLGLLAIAPASAQQPSDVDVAAFVAPGKTLIVMREALDQLLRIEPAADSTDAYLDYLETAGAASVSATYFLPAERVGDTIVVKRGNFRTYSADVKDGHVGALSLEKLVDDEPSDGEGSNAFNSTALLGDMLLEIDRTFDALRSKYGSDLNLGDMLISYAAIKVRKSGAGKSADFKTAAYAVFTSPAQSYTVLLEDGEIHEIYEGIVATADWLTPRYR